MAPADLNLECAADVPPPVNLTATDNCEGEIVVCPTATITPGDCINDFVMVRTWTFVDDCGNTSSVSQTITVNDVPPTFSVPSDITIYKDADCNYDADVSITGDVWDESDNCSTGLEAEYSDVVDESNPSMVIITRTWTLVDECDNVENQTQIITAEDITPPEIYPKEAPIVLWPPNHKYVKINMENMVKDVWDNCSEVEVDQVTIVRATSDEEENAKGKGDGNTLKDIKIAPDCKSVKLRKERNVIDDGAIYEVNRCFNNKSSLIDYQEDETRNQFIVYPNPFTTLTTIEYELNQPDKVTLTIFDHLGKQIYQAQKIQLQGKQQLTWHADGYADGVYYYRLHFGNFITNGRMVKLK